MHLADMAGVLSTQLWSVEYPVWPPARLMPAFSYHKAYLQGHVHTHTHTYPLTSGPQKAGQREPFLHHPLSVFPILLSHPRTLNPLFLNSIWKCSIPLADTHLLSSEKNPRLGHSGYSSYLVSNDSLKLPIVCSPCWPIWVWLVFKAVPSDLDPWAQLIGPISNPGIPVQKVLRQIFAPLKI